jgi:hypothetical protein
MKSYELNEHSNGAAAGDTESAVKVIDDANLSHLHDPCTSSQLARVLGKSPKTIVDWCQERAYTHIPCFRLGNRWYHRPAELMRWLNGIKSGHVEFRRKPRISAERK